MKRRPEWWVFWISVGVVLYTYVGFPLLVILRGRLCPRPVRRSAAFLPRVSLIIAAHNEGSVIGRKMENVLALNYPRDRLEVIVASDGSDDGTVDIARSYEKQGVRLLDLPRQGKNRTVNAAVNVATGDILVFSDADIQLERDSLRQLVAPFADPEVGGAGGDWRYAVDATHRGFWAIERTLSIYLSRAGSMTAVYGALYAIRRPLFRPVPDYVADDSFIGKQVPAAHMRLVYEPGAIAYPLADYASSSWFGRGIRVSMRRWWAILEHYRLLNPFEYGFYAVQLFSHKVLRRLVGVPFFLLLVASLALSGQGLVYRLAALAQLAGHAIGVYGFLRHDSALAQRRPFSTLGHFEMVTVASLVGLANVLRGYKYGTWAPQRESEGPGVDPEHVGRG